MSHLRHDGGLTHRAASVLVTLLLAAGILVPVTSALAPSVSAAPTVTNFTGTGIDEPDGITAGPDGALWFTNPANNSIGRITTSGTVTNYTGTGIDDPDGITAGPDGALWFTNFNNNSIGRITTSGTVTNYTGTGIDEPDGITAGPDGALWFTNVGNNLSIGRITTSGTVTNYTGTGIDVPIGITAGPDGALWFTNLGNNSIGRITTSGMVTDYTGTGIAYPHGITAGPDGALWFTNLGDPLYGENSIGRITTSGTVTNYTAGIDGPEWITAGPDGALWFTNVFNPDSIGRITTSGTVTNYTGTGIDGLDGITAGPDGALWFTNGLNNSIGRITTGANPSTSVLIPSNGGALGGTSVLLDASASAGAGVATVQFVLTGGSYNESVIGTASPTIYGYLFDWNSTSVPGGAYTLQSLVTDSDGNTAYSTGTTITVDNAPPATAVLIPSNGAHLKRTAAAVLDASASASFGVQITKVQFVLTGRSYNKSVIGTATPTVYGWVFVWNSTLVHNGKYTLQSVATDAAGNTAYSPGITIKVTK